MPSRADRVRYESGRDARTTTEAVAGTRSAAPANRRPGSAHSWLGLGGPLRLVHGRVRYDRVEEASMTQAEQTIAGMALPRERAGRVRRTNELTGWAWAGSQRQNQAYTNTPPLVEVLDREIKVALPV